MYSNKILYVIYFFLYLLLIPSIISQQYSVDEHTLALWHFDEANGQLVYDVVHSNNGIIINTSDNKNVLRTDGGSGRSIKFVGTNYITIPNNKLFNFEGNESFTIEALFISNSTSDQRIIYKQPDPQGTNGYAIFLGSSVDGAGKITGIIWSNGKLNRVTTLKTYNDGAWHHVAFVRDTFNHKLLLYIDNSLENSIDETLNGSLNNSANLLIGTSGIKDFPYFFYGLIDEVRISNSARTKFNIDINNLSKISLSDLEFIEVKTKETLEKKNIESFNKNVIEIDASKGTKPSTVNANKDNDIFYFFIIILLVIYLHRKWKSVKEKALEAERAGKRAIEDMETKIVMEKEKERTRQLINRSKKHASKIPFKSTINILKGTEEKMEQENYEEIKDFFRNMEIKMKDKTLDDPSNDVYKDDRNFGLFNGFISNTKNSLDIMTNVIEGKLLAELLWNLRKKGISVRIITRNLKERKYLEEFVKDSKIEFIQMNNIHAKMIIRDNERILMGSSNITNASVSKTGGFLDVNIISDDKDSVRLAKAVFESALSGEDLASEHDNPNILFVYTRNSENHLSKRVSKLIEQETDEIVFLMGSDLIDKEVIDKWIIPNKKCKKTIITSSKWMSDVFSEAKMATMKYLSDLSEHPTKEISVFPKENDIHAKVYLFRGQGKVLISSQNLTIDSWQTLFENGFIINNKNRVDEMIDEIKKIPDRHFDGVKNYTEIDKPGSTWTGTTKEKKQKMPWDMPESDPNWRIKKSNKYNKYYVNSKKKLSVDKTPDKKDRSSGFVNKGKFHDTIPKEVRPYITLNISPNSSKKAMEKAITKAETGLNLKEFENMPNIREAVNDYIEHYIEYYKKLLENK